MDTCMYNSYTAIRQTFPTKDITISPHMPKLVSNSPSPHTCHTCQYLVRGNSLTGHNLHHTGALGNTYETNVTVNVNIIWK